MTTEQIKRMTEAELVEFLGLDSKGLICREDGCYNRCALGLVVCIECHFGPSATAAEVYVTAKKRLENTRSRK